MPRVLALDPGFRLGHGFLGGPRLRARSGSHAIKGSSEQMGEAFRFLRPLVLRLIKQYRPEVIVVALPFIGRMVTPVQLRPIFGFDCMIQIIADEAGVPFRRIHESDARKAFMGGVPRKSKFIKEAVMAECRSRGWPACDNHAADALCVASFMMEKMEPKKSHEMTPLFAASRGKRVMA